MFGTGHPVGEKVCESVSVKATVKPSVRYGARPEGLARPSSNDGPIWADNLEAVYLTDADAVAAVLPPPLEPGDEPMLRFSIATWSRPHGELEGEGRLTVQARHGDTSGEYPLLVVRTTEHDVVEARERMGEPAKLAQITSTINDRRIDNKIERMGYTVGRIVGTVDSEDRPTPTMRSEFMFRVRRSADDAMALADDPELVLVHRSIEERRATTVKGIVRLGQSPFDPIRDLPVRNTRFLRLAQQLVTTTVSSIDTVPAAEFLPFLHQRYDDLSVLDKWR